jgi:hypothetical protein
MLLKRQQKKRRMSFLNCAGGMRRRKDPIETAKPLEASLEHEKKT